MNAKDLRRMEPEELLDWLSRAVIMAKSAMGQLRSVGVKPALNNSEVGFRPLIELGDFEIWPRDDQPHGERCQECGSGTGVSMMVVRGPMAFESGAAERHFCSVKCFWDWVERAREDRNIPGFPLEDELKWKDKTSPN